MKTKLIYSSDQVNEVAHVGGKAHRLQKLIGWRANVAPFFVIGTSGDGKVTEEIRKEILDFLSKHRKIILRSSVTCEDDLDASFAGLFETILDVEAGNWESSLQKIYASLDSPRVKNYRARKNLEVDLKMAVVVQKQIDVKKSGVFFTRAPVRPTSAVAIDAAFGSGAGVVSGSVDLDHYLLTRLGEVIEGQENKVLTSLELELLLKESLRLEKVFGAPADIEWGLSDDEFFVFQIRPITQLFSPLKVIADTSLSDSYPGVVSPFTASFVRRSYENAFLEAAKILGYEGKRLEDLKEHCAQLIVAVDDHLYFDLEHYYATLRSLPGGEKNIENWNKLIGGQISGAEIPYHDTKVSGLEFGTSIYKLARLGVKKKRTYRAFIGNLESFSMSIQKDLKKLNNSRLTIQYLCHLVDRPLGFGLTVVNDLYIMIGTGKLSATLKKQGLSEDVLIDLLRTDHSLDTIKPLEAYEELLSLLSTEFLDDFEKIRTPAGFAPYQEAFELLEGKWPDDVATLRRFLEEYGDRSFEELKLESLPLKNDPDLLKKLVRWGKQNKSVEQPIKRLAPPSVKLGLLDQQILTFTRSNIEFRETTRLWKGRFFHQLRQLVIKLAQQLAEEDPEFKDYQLRDFFSLTHIEWRSYYDHELSDQSVRDLMDSRKWQEKQQVYPEFACWAEDEALPQMKASHTSASNLKGQGVSPGVVEGQALVLESPTEILGSYFEDFILVTKNTDPAWVYIMSRSKGLISEKGSLLGHTAIIGRELGIPTLVGLRSATQQIKTGDKLRIDGTTGEVKIL